MLRLIASDTTTSRSNITSYSSSSTQETLERAPIHQDVGAFKINVASLLHPSSPDDPTSIISNNMIHPSTTTPSSLSPFILTNNDALRYPLTHASRRIETQQPHSQQLPATPPYWRLPPLTYDSNFTPTATSGSSTTDNIPSVCQASYEQSHRPEARNTQQQHHHHNHSQHYEASNLLASSSSRRESSSSSSNPSLASLHNIDQNHQHQQQMQHSLQRPSATVTAAGSVVSSNKQSAASSSLEAPPDRPELILRTRPILNAGRHSQEDVVLPSLREQLGGLAPPPDEDENNSG
ncbi:hypothetical protein BDB00DRAFT_489187 [Zychaea mexicana]|uniref:uncharacterized protein n=1 Tax=Zychaea mexicana TaxID=64656 RepID=UPI0022FF3D79|nr:uncharacterized protein BDB00DRAFT_489187 [Zychaea mexicana]KAI9491402.1 hypothetical protein BDB00DRAFT_489187 [Zychaea mexicana]